MGLPKIVIVGRPNVGKSALFNRIVGKRIAIVDEAEGVTRDRLYGVSECFGRPFEIVDTGGIDARSTALFNAEVKAQAELAIEEGDALILVVDGQVGLTDLDLELARMLRTQGKPLCVAVNKVDEVSHEPLIHAFHSLGIPDMVGTSASHGRNIAEVLECVIDQVEQGEVEESKYGKVAIIGRPNVGKSTLINTLLHEDRCIVSPIAGTTRDSIDTHITVNEIEYTLIDTAGIRRKGAEHEVVDKFAAIRTERAIERSDVCVLVIDAEAGMTTQDKRIATLIEEAGKGCVLLFNKWDLVKGHRMEHCQKAARDAAPFLGHCPMIFGSATTGRNVDKIFSEVEVVFKERYKRVSTGLLNKFITTAMQLLHPPVIRDKRLRIYYMTQVSNAPPRFALFVNYPDLMAQSYERYLYNQLRKEFGFIGNPVIFTLKAKIRKTAEERHARDLLEQSVQPQ